MNVVTHLYSPYYDSTKIKFSVEGSLKAEGDTANDNCRELRNSTEISEKRQLLTLKTSKQLKKAHQTLEELKRTVSLKVREKIRNKIFPFSLKANFPSYFYVVLICKEEYLACHQDDKENEQVKTQVDKSQTSSKQGIAHQSSDFEISYRQRKQSEANSDGSIHENDNVTDGERRIGQQRAEIIRFEHCLKNMAELLDLTARAPRK